MKYIIIFIASFLVAVSISGCGANPDYQPTFDDTDNKISGQRSGMILLIDHGTGCQYLFRKSGIYPRMNKQGKQVCQ